MGDIRNIDRGMQEKYFAPSLLEKNDKGELSLGRIFKNLSKQVSVKFNRIIHLIQKGEWINNKWAMKNIESNISHLKDNLQNKNLGDQDVVNGLHELVSDMSTLTKRIFKDKHGKNAEAFEKLKKDLKQLDHAIDDQLESPKYDQPRREAIAKKLESQPQERRKLKEFAFNQKDAAELRNFPSKEDKLTEKMGRLSAERAEELETLGKDEWLTAPEKEHIKEQLKPEKRGARREKLLEKHVKRLEQERKPKNVGDLSHADKEPLETSLKKRDVQKGQHVYEESLMDEFFEERYQKAKAPKEALERFDPLKNKTSKEIEEERKEYSNQKLHQKRRDETEKELKSLGKEEWMTAPEKEHLEKNVHMKNTQRKHGVSPYQDPYFGKNVPKSEKPKVGKLSEERKTEGEENLHHTLKHENVQKGKKAYQESLEDEIHQRRMDQRETEAMHAKPLDKSRIQKANENFTQTLKPGNEKGRKAYQESLEDEIHQRKMDHRETEGMHAKPLAEDDKRKKKLEKELNSPKVEKRKFERGREAKIEGEMYQQEKDIKGLKDELKELRSEVRRLRIEENKRHGKKKVE